MPVVQLQGSLSARAPGAGAVIGRAPSARFPRGARSGPALGGTAVGCDGPRRRDRTESDAARKPWPDARCATPGEARGERYAGAANMAERAISSIRTLAGSNASRFSRSRSNVCSKDGKVFRARLSGVVRART